MVAAQTCLCHLHRYHRHPRRLFYRRLVQGWKSCFCKKNVFIHLHLLEMIPLETGRNVHAVKNRLSYLRLQHPQLVMAIITIFNL